MVEMSSDYQKRAAENGFASPDQVREALAHPETIVLDVRSDAEVEATGHLGTPQVVTTHCHYCREFDHIANEKIPKKDGTFAICAVLWWSSGDSPLG